MRGAAARGAWVCPRQAALHKGETRLGGRDEHGMEDISIHDLWLDIALLCFLFC